MIIDHTKNGSFTKLSLCYTIRGAGYFIKGARGVMVIVVRNGHGEMSSNPGQS